MTFLKDIFRQAIYLFRLMGFVVADDIIRMGSKPVISEYGLFLIRLDSIGDFFLWLDQAKEYRNLYPHERILLIANKVYFDLADKLSYWDKVIGIDTTRYLRHPFYRIKTNIELSKYSFSTTISPVFSRTFLLSDSIVRICRSRNKFGYDGDRANNEAPRSKLRGLNPAS